MKAIFPMSLLLASAIAHTESKRYVPTDAFWHVKRQVGKIERIRGG